VTAILAQLLHLALLGLIAPLLATVLRWAATGFAGSPAALARRMHADLIRLWRKRPPVVEPAVPLLRAVPAISLALTAIAALLVPSFALGMALSPLADLFTIGGLLLLARLLSVLAALDAGTAQGSLAATGVVRLRVLAEAAALPAILALALGVGSLSLEQFGAIRLDDALLPGVARGLAAAALAVIAVADLAATALDDALAGPDLTLARITETLRLLVWFNLILTLFVPIGLAPANAGPAEWPLAILTWLGRLAALTALVAIARAILGPLPELAGGLAVLAVILVLTQAGPA
jgi:formate hydrogenlyase subunit 4